MMESTKGGDTRASGGEEEGTMGGGGGDEAGEEVREKAPLSYSESEGTEEEGERSLWGSLGGGEDEDEDEEM